MIKYRYANVGTGDARYILVEILDYDSESQNNLFDTISCNNNWDRVPVLMQDRKVFANPSEESFSGVARFLHNKYLADGGDMHNLRWVGPFDL